MASPPTGLAPRLALNPPGASRWQDLAAGLCVAGLLIPEAVAYAGLAHLPAVHALTAAMIGLALYAALGRSRFAIVAPTSSTAVLSAAAAMSIAAPGASADPAAYAGAFTALVLMAGVVLVLLAWARQGQLSAFVSRPVLRGFAFALAITIVIKQLPDAFGFELPQKAGADPFHALLFAVTHVREWHVPTVAVALLAGALIAGLKRWPRVPASMLVIALAIAAAYGLDLKALGVAEVGVIEAPAFHFDVPRLPWAEWVTAGELAVGLVVLIFAESWGSMRTMALAHGDTLDANRELMVLGACNIGAALFQGMPVGAGFSATSANAAAGASSRWAGVAALVAVGLAVAFALPAVHLLPRPVLAVAVISALWHALSARPLLTTWRMNRDRLLIVGAVAAVLFFGVLYGMLIAIALSLLAALRRFSQPVVHELGELGATRNFVALDGHSGAAAVPGLLVLRPEEPLFFACAERVVSTILHKLEGRDDLRVVVLSLEESSDLDSTAAECLLELNQHLRGSGRSLVLARVKEPVRDLLHFLDPDGLGRTDGMFWSVDDAVQAARAAQQPKGQA
ncbi:putative sulfate transporterc/MT1781 [Variovorax sp. SRS16]|uniref:SulP family inorganic anion transporter n=1 Tax=Variovorax sp. SRS16 TaxID=282217 RepID=UPI001317636E|nr:SulP family inorganic anion transporter [Variovorax sp. SRS16]VTU15457.1 putative sulfate transporterc/MT1781 [Variovorax sp. SRS16]